MGRRGENTRDEDWRERRERRLRVGGEARHRRRKREEEEEEEEVEEDRKERNGEPKEFSSKSVTKPGEVFL